MMLLTRNNFRTQCLIRDKKQCVICKEPAVDVHHIIERRLFHDGGYYLDNGAALCSKHHIAAEETTLTCNQIREAISIHKIILPEHLYKDLEYDKWGNIILANGRRLPGELFDDLSVRKILGDKLGLFTLHIKYPRTYHLPWSDCIKDDKIIANVEHFQGREIIITEKMDGENTTMYSNYIHARSIDSKSHVTRSMVKNMHAKMCADIPSEWRVCGENLFAQHSIAYKDLASYFLVFSIWNLLDCLSWNDTLEWCELLGIKAVPVLYRGIWNRDIVDEIQKKILSENISEGYVVRLANSFHYKDFKYSCNKFVRNDFIRTQNHWMKKSYIQNQLT